MSVKVSGINEVDASAINSAEYKAHLADCVVLTHDGKLLLQQRPLTWRTSAGFLTAFGGHVDDGETVMQGLVRELKEELGAVVDPDDVVLIGAITEDDTGNAEMVHVHFWQDKNSTITGCYEAEAVEYDDVSAAMLHPKMMDYLRWALLTCQSKGLLA